MSNHLYTTPENQFVRMLYATRTATMAYLPTTEADALLRGNIPSISAESLAALREAEALVDVDCDERSQVLERQREVTRDRSHLRYVLLPTTYCNMGCTYCGQEHRRGGLSSSHREAVAQRVLAGIARATTSSVRISWFGGEPMVGYSVVRQLSSRFVAAADNADVGYEATMITNGSLLTADKLATLHNECKVWRFDITLDGPAEIHDVHRPLKNGGKSFDHITRIISAALKDPSLSRLVFVLRTNVDIRNVDWVDAYLDQIAALGFANDQIFMNIAPVYSWGNDVSELAIERARFAEHELRWMTRMNKLGLRFKAVPTNTVGALCAAVTRATEVHSSTGNLFSCSEYPLVPEHEASGGLGRIGDLPTLELRPTGPFDDWHDAIAAGETPCHSCPFLPVCGGACPKQWREGKGLCPTYKYDIQNRLDLVARMSGLAIVAT